MFVSNVKDIMKEAGYTLLGLADEAGVSQRTIQKARDQRIETCTLKTLSVLAATLGVGLKALFDDGTGHGGTEEGGPAFTSRVAALMKEKDLTIRALVAETGLSSATIQNARDERIGSCSLKTLAVIAEALDVEVKQLFDEAHP